MRKSLSSKSGSVEKGVQGGQRAEGRVQGEQEPEVTMGTAQRTWEEQCAL